MIERERGVNIVYPDLATRRKRLKTLAGGDPNGIATSPQFQRESIVYLPISGASVPLGLTFDCLTFSRSLP